MVACSQEWRGWEWSSSVKNKEDEHGRLQSTWKNEEDELNTLQSTLNEDGHWSLLSRVKKMDIVDQHESIQSTKLSPVNRMDVSLLSKWLSSVNSEENRQGCLQCTVKYSVNKVVFSQQWREWAWLSSVNMEAFSRCGCLQLTLSSAVNNEEDGHGRL